MMEKQHRSRKEYAQELASYFYGTSHWHWSRGWITLNDSALVLSEQVDISNSPEIVAQLPHDMIISLCRWYMKDDNRQHSKHYAIRILTHAARYCMGFSMFGTVDNRLCNNTNPHSMNVADNFNRQRGELFFCLEYYMRTVASLDQQSQALLADLSEAVEALPIQNKVFISVWTDTTEIYDLPVIDRRYMQAIGGGILEYIRVENGRHVRSVRLAPGGPLVVQMQ